MGDIVDRHHQRGPRPGDLAGALVGTPTWTESQLAAAGVHVADVRFVTVGGGLGSFAMVDHLRIAGVPTEQIRVLGPHAEPHHTYRWLCHNSQIPDHERLRSDSASTMDNVWGFPGYAIREAFAARRLREAVAPLWQVAVEPILADYYTPTAGQVFASVEREAQRIEWSAMLTFGQVRTVRRRRGGGYFVLLTPARDGWERPARVAYRCQFAHLAVGYPALRFLPDLQKYRDTYGDFTRVVNAYEPHEHVYRRLLARPGVVVVRGSGIVASRILQRLIDDRDHHGAGTTILHLFRTYVDGAQGDSVRFRRPGGGGFAYQGFNVAKAAWGGQLRDRVLALEGAERAALLRQLAGTNTPKRRRWREQLARGRREGFYRQIVGVVEDVEPADGERIATKVRLDHGATAEVVADFVVDATGLEGSPREHRLLADLLEHGGAGTNPSGRLDVDRSFEVRGTRSQPGRLYASGSATFGGYYAGVDSFLGLQYAAQRICTDLAEQGFGAPLTSRRSIGQWVRWVRNAAP